MAGSWAPEGSAWLNQMTQLLFPAPLQTLQIPEERISPAGRVISCPGVSQTEELPRVWDFKGSYRDSSRQTRVSVS